MDIDHHINKAFYMLENLGVDKVRIDHWRNQGITLELVKSLTNWVEGYNTASRQYQSDTKTQRVTGELLDQLYLVHDELARRAKGPAKTHFKLFSC